MGMLNSTEGSYRGQAMFNILFFRLGPAGADLQSLGVKPEELRYRGMHSYMAGAPTGGRGWSGGVGRGTGAGGRGSTVAGSEARGTALSRDALVHGGRADGGSRLDRGVWQANGVRAPGGVVRAAPGENVGVPGGNTEKWRGGNAA